MRTPTCNTKLDFIAEIQFSAIVNYEVDYKSMNKLIRISFPISGTHSPLSLSIKP